MKFYIETERLILRDLLYSDADDFFRMDSNAAVHQFLGNNPIKTVQQIIQVISNVHQQYEENGIGRWATIEKSTGHFIGWSGLKFIREPENNRINYYDVGYRFHPDYWGKGFATESAKAALNYGFEVLNVDEIIGTCHEDNKASRRALEKCGFKFIQKFIYDNKLTCDWLEITKLDWEKLERKNT